MLQLRKKKWVWECIAQNKFNNHHYFQSSLYKKKMSKVLHDTIHEELIIKACHLRRVLNWMDEVNEPDCIYYGMTQADINKLFFIIKMIYKYTYILTFFLHTPHIIGLKS